MWYPFKFRGNLSYATIGGVLADELGCAASTPTWKRRRRWRLARRKHSDFVVAAIDRSARPVVEAWTDTPDHRFASVILRFETDDGVFVWTESREQQGGFRMFRLEPGQPSVAIECRSGRMVGWSTIIEGRTVNVLHPEHLPMAEAALKLVPLQTILEQ